MFRWTAARFAHFDETDLTAITDAAMRIWRRVPMTIDGTDELFDYLRAFGCTVDGMKVTFTDRAIDATMARVVRMKQAAAPFDPFDRPVMNGATSGQATWCVDTRTNELRHATADDLASFSRVVDALGYERRHPTYLPQDKPLETRELHAFCIIALNSHKPHRVSMYSHEVLPFYMDIMEVIFGGRAEAIAQALPLRAGSMYVTTPMTIGRESVDLGMTFRRLTGHPLRLFTMPGPGMSTPVTPAGTLAASAAECLAMNAIVLAVDDQLLGWSVGPNVFDVKSAASTVWGPDYMLNRIGGMLMDEHLFGTPPIGPIMGYGSAALPGAQSAMERAVEISVNFMAGAREQTGLGALATADAASAVQLMIDAELMSMFAHAHRGFEVNAETIAEQVIAEFAPRGAVFLEADHTLDNLREVNWTPNLVERRSLGSWLNDPADLIDRARQRAIDMERDAPNRCPLDDAQRRVIRQILDQADRALCEKSAAGAG
jgi:trimethylamine:corrinoid methyltransferase-like protein